MRLACALRHVAFEDLDGFEPALAARGFSVSYVEAATDDLAASPAATADLLIVLGGPIGAFEDAAYPFLVPETALIARRLERGKPVLGICLGAQLMARALGARVYPSGVKEIGFAPIELSDAGARSPLAAMGLATPVLHWHGDIFDLPAGATHLARTAATPNQAFAWQRHGLALQFHVETTRRGLERWFVGHTLEIATTPGTSVAGLRADAQRFAAPLVTAGTDMLGRWLDALES